jgi:hypothetical protein
MMIGSSSLTYVQTHDPVLDICQRYQIFSASFSTNTIHHGTILTDDEKTEIQTILSIPNATFICEPERDYLEETDRLVEQTDGLVEQCKRW